MCVSQSWLVLMLSILRRHNDFRWSRCSSVNCYFSVIFIPLIPLFPLSTEYNLFIEKLITTYCWAHLRPPANYVSRMMSVFKSAVITSWLPFEVLILVSCCERYLWRCRTSLNTKSFATEDRHQREIQWDHHSHPDHAFIQPVKRRLWVNLNAVGSKLYVSNSIVCKNKIYGWKYNTIK